MWTLTPDYLQQVKEELKGRRAAIEARYVDELKAITSELDEIEGLERLAYDFAVKHLPGLNAASSPDGPPVAAPSDQPATLALSNEAAAPSHGASVAFADLQLASTETAPGLAMELSPEVKRSASRWRMRGDA